MRMLNACHILMHTFFTPFCSFRLWLRRLGNDGGLKQYFMLEVVGGNPVNTEATKDFQDNTLANEISTMNDQVRELILQPSNHVRRFHKIHLFYATEFESVYVCVCICVRI